MKPAIAILMGALLVGLLRAQMYSGVLRPHKSRPPLLDLMLQLGAVALVAFLLRSKIRRAGDDTNELAPGKGAMSCATGTISVWNMGPSSL